MPFFGRICVDTYAPAEENKEAKRFSGDPDHCSIYVVRTDNMPETGLALFRVRLDGRSAGVTGPRTFFLWQTTPGKHEIGTQSVGPGDFTLTVNFVCRAGDQLFFTQNESGTLNVAAPAVGRSEVMRADRMLSAF